MGHSLSWQFKTTIEDNMRIGGNKHEDKQNGTSQENIYSYGERANLMDRIDAFSDYMKFNHSEIKMVRDIRVEHINSYLDSCKDTCNANSLKQYASQFSKLETLVEKTFHCNIDWHKGLEIPTASSEAFRTVTMTREDYNKILDYCYKNGSQSQAVPAIELAGRFGLRVSETTSLKVSDIDFESDRIHVCGKGGRERYLEIGENADYLHKLVDDKGAKDRLVNIKADSVNAFLTRMEDKLGLKEYTEHRSGIHAIRKMCAEEIYKECREGGMDKQEALDRTSNYLGHGNDRNETLCKHYLKDPQ